MLFFNYTPDEYFNCMGCRDFKHISDLRPDPVYPTELVCETCYIKLCRDTAEDRINELKMYGV